MLFLLRLWIFLCAGVTAIGWGLSLVGALNRAGYLSGFVLLALFARWYFRGAEVIQPGAEVRKLSRRFKRLLPALFLTLALLSILGGLLYPPVNIDGFSYRLPRALHWIGAQRWHWIHSADVRLNVVAPGFDLLSTPLLLFSRSDRSITFINASSFLLLPGALFLCLARLGVRRSVAARWMWIIPAGFCYFMQAGSIANDMYATIFTLGAVGFVLRARESGRMIDFWSSVLALALATNAKQTLIPFGLPWLIAALSAFPGVHLCLARTVFVLLLAIAASVVPITFFNLQNTGDWSGLVKGHDYSPPNALWGILGNTFWLLFANLQPPIVPWAGRWNALRLEFLQSDAGAPFRGWDQFAYLQRAASEQYAGLGSTVLLLVLASWFLARRSGRMPGGLSLERAIRLSIWLGFFAFMAKVGINQATRYLTGWYPFLVSSFLISSGHSTLSRKRLWHGAAAFVLGISIALTILSRQRPLFPAETLLSLLQSHGTGLPGLQKVINSYTFANSLRTEMEPFLARIPPDVKTIGYAVRFGDKEPFLWRPYFERRVVRIMNSDPPEVVRALPIDYIVVSPGMFTTEQDPAIVREPMSPRWDISSIDEWTRTYGAEIVATVENRIHPEKPPETHYLVRLKR